ncbi:hypothetical protein DAI22_11g079750 [Oryza sativa Japonica Group]|nr:hypothetical protein DAI22_11g079750 [Oryza sativa Japonica Group]
MVSSFVHKQQADPQSAVSTSNKQHQAIKSTSKKQAGDARTSIQIQFFAITILSSRSHWPVAATVAALFITASAVLLPCPSSSFPSTACARDHLRRRRTGQGPGPLCLACSVLSASPLESGNWSLDLQQQAIVFPNIK